MPALLRTGSLSAARSKQTRAKLAAAEESCSRRAAADHSPVLMSSPKQLESHVFSCHGCRMVVQAPAAPCFGIRFKPRITVLK